MKAEPKIEWQGAHLRVAKCGKWEYVERVGVTGAVVIAAVTEEGNLILTEQYRPPVARRVIELPAGLAGDIAGHEKEELAEAALRELLEETGYEATEMTSVACGPPSAGLSNEMVTFFRATGLRSVGPGGGDEHEDIKIHHVPLKEVRNWLQKRSEEGVLIDPKVYVGMYFLSARLP